VDIRGRGKLNLKERGDEKEQKKLLNASGEVNVMEGRKKRTRQAGS